MYELGTQLTTTFVNNPPNTYSPQGVKNDQFGLTAQYSTQNEAKIVSQVCVFDIINRLPAAI